jgi:hypothetical protein
MVKVSPVPLGPLSVTSATKVQGAPVSMQVPAMVAELPLISSEVSVTLRTSVPFAGFTNCRPPLMRWVVLGRLTMKLKDP